MKIKLSKKTKTFLSVATAIIASTAVTTLLTSCSSAKESNIIDTGGYDKEYGINDVTYARMEEDFKTLYKSQLDENKKSGKIDDSTYNLNLSTFQNNLNSIHASLYSDENKTLSYTIRTNVLRDYARNNYGIRLSRQSNVSLSVTISGIKNSIVDSVLLWCKEYKITDTDTYRKNAETEFDIFYKEAIAEYGEDDVVSIVQYVQTGMIGCFKGICKELDCLAAQQQLKDFIANYEINVKENVDENYYWDKLLSKYGEGGKEISVEDFNSIFTMTYEETDPQSSSSSYFSSSKKTVKFENDMITGYTLKPILVKMNSNPYTNVYSIDVDYTLVNNNYKDDEKVAELTAHSSALKDKSFYENENISIFDLNANESEREYTNYVLPITKGYEEKQINETYFNNKDFKFTWSTSEEYGYDNFWTEPNEKVEYKGKLNVSGLATSGMMINNIPLIDILNQAGKISLSGGSVSLSGKAKTKGEDSKQWKLIVDGNEIKNEDISWKLVTATTANLPDSIRINDGVVSWTDQIEAGTYNFYVLAIYKETKIQSPLVTLTISSSKQSENTGNLNYAIKDALYDEDTIDQKLIDFVNNVKFSLDYTENDYDTEREDHKKGEINVDDFIIGYENSKNTFKASNAINEAISSAINNDSGITTKWSKNLWSNIRDRYNDVVSVVGLKKLKEITVSEIESVDNAKLTYLIVHSIALTLVGALIALIAVTAFKKGIIKDNKWKLIIAAVISLILIGALLWAILDILDIMGSSWKNLNDKLDSIDPTKTSYQIIKNIHNDEKYFISEDGKAEFDKLSTDDMRNKKVYYESGYKLTKGETESDLTKYLGGKAAHEELINKIKGVLESYKWMFLLTALTAVVVAIVLACILVFLIKAGQTKPANEGVRIGHLLDNVGRQGGADANDNNNIMNNARDNVNPN